MLTIKIRSHFLLLSVPALCSAVPASAAPVQATEPAVHIGSPPPAVNVPTIVDVPKWRLFTSAEGGFSILLPSSPITETRELSASKETLHLFHCHVKHKSYIIQYADKDPTGIRILGPEKILSILDNAIIKVSRGSVISRRHLVLGKYPGHEVIIMRLSGSRETQRTYLVANRLYILTTTYPPQQAEASPTDSDKFLNSFTLLSAKVSARNP